jgi:TonB dependent receptor
LPSATTSTRLRARPAPVSDLEPHDLAEGQTPGEVGGTWEHADSVGYWGFFDPARVYLLSPEFLAGVNPALPALFGLPDGIVRNQADLQKLPVVSFLLGIGDPAQPSDKLDDARANDRYHLYVQDSWQATDALTLNFGLGWQHESNVLNHDLDKPAYLAPIYGNDLGATKKQYKNFSPAVGFAWNLGGDRPTVIRGGAGTYYDTQLGWWRLGERAVIGGSGRQFIGNAAVINPLTGQPFTTAYLLPAADAGPARAAGREISRHRRRSARSCCPSRPPRSARSTRAISRRPRPITSISGFSASWAPTWPSRPTWCTGRC